MPKLPSLLFVIALLAWLIVPAANAQPQIYGNLSGSLGPGEYIVIGDCNVQSGVTLTIQPGTTFLHATHAIWSIYGTLSAEGTEADPIIFERQYETEACKWGGIRIYNSSANNTVLDYCVVDYCKNTYYPTYYGGGIYVSGSTPTISNTTISNCYASSGGGAYITGSAGPVFDSCTFVNNTAGNGGGIYIYNQSNNTVIKNSIVAKNSSTST